MKASYTPLLSWFAIALGASLMLYHTSDRVHALNLKLHKLDTDIMAERQSLHVLKAEWVYLANPARIEAAVHRHLLLQPTEPKRVAAALRDIADALPLRAGSQPAQTASAAPAAEPAATLNSLENSTGHITVASASYRGPFTGSATIGMPAAPHVAAVAASADDMGGLLRSLSLRP